MHVPRIETRTLDETVEALDLGQTPADIVFLSFSDSDLNALARAYDAFPSRSRAQDRFARGVAPSVLGRPPSRKGVRARQARGRALAWRGATIGATAWMNSVRWRAGATSNWRCCLGTGAATPALTRPRHSIPTRSSRSGAILTRAALRTWRLALLFSRPRSVARGPFRRRSRSAPSAASTRPVSRPGPDSARALVVFYRSIYLADDLEPIEALARALHEKGFAVTSIFVTSLKDDSALEPLARLPRRAVLRCRSQRHRLLRASGSGRGNGTRHGSMRRCCKSCWLALASTPGGDRRADSGLRISRCMWHYRRSTDEF